MEVVEVVCIVSIVVQFLLNLCGCGTVGCGCGEFEQFSLRVERSVSNALLFGVFLALFFGEDWCSIRCVVQHQSLEGAQYILMTSVLCPPLCSYSLLCCVLCGTSTPPLHVLHTSSAS